MRIRTRGEELKEVTNSFFLEAKKAWDDFHNLKICRQELENKLHCLDSGYVRAKQDILNRDAIE